MSCNECVFVILRHITYQLQNADEIWKECYKSIRRFYNNKIIIIDNNSDYSLIKDDIVLVNCETIQSLAYETRVYSPFFELLNLDFDRAVIIHDGIIFKKYVDFHKFNDVKFIWHFLTRAYDDKPLIEKQLISLTNNTPLFDIFSKQQFIGCIGCCLAITKDFLMKMENTYKISNLKSIIRNQNDAMAFERTLSVMCFSLKNDLIDDISFEGEQLNMVWGYTYNHFITDKTLFDTHDLSYIKPGDVIDINKKSIVKIFGARK